MATGTKYDPQNINEFEKSKLMKDGKGVSGTATAGQSTNFDLALSDDFLVTNGFLMAKGGAAGDKVDFKVLYGETVVAQFITDWFVNPDSTQQDTPKSYFPAKLAAGLTIRLVYHSIGETDVWVAINFDREKVLV